MNTKKEDNGGVASIETSDEKYPPRPDEAESHKDLGQKLLFSSRLPDKVMGILLTHEAEDAIHWLPNGESFVMEETKFQRDILLKYFRGNKFKSMIRNLHRWGFKRITGESESSVVFSHPLFLQKHPERVKEIQMLPKKSKKVFAKEKAKQYQQQEQQEDDDDEEALTKRTALATEEEDGKTGADGSDIRPQNIDTSSAVLPRSDDVALAPATGMQELQSRVGTWNANQPLSTQRASGTNLGLSQAEHVFREHLLRDQLLREQLLFAHNPRSQPTQFGLFGDSLGTSQVLGAATNGNLYHNILANRNLGLTALSALRPQAGGRESLFSNLTTTQQQQPWFDTSAASAAAAVAAARTRLSAASAAHRGVPGMMGRDRVLLNALARNEVLREAELDIQRRLLRITGGGGGGGGTVSNPPLSSSRLSSLAAAPTPTPTILKPDTTSGCNQQNKTNN